MGTKGTWVALCKPRWIDPPDKIFMGDHARVIRAAKKWWADFWRAGFEPEEGHPWSNDDGYDSEVLEHNTEGLLTMVCFDQDGDGPTILFREVDGQEDPCDIDGCPVCTGAT